MANQPNADLEPESLEEFIDWLRHPPRHWNVTDPSKIEAANRTLQSFIDEHDKPRGQGQVIGAKRDTVWWIGLAVRDFGDYRLVYMGE